MPVTPSARKKMRQDKKRRLINLRVLEKLKKLLSIARKNPTLENLKKASVIIDRAAKRGIIHENKAARLKSRLAKRVIVKKPVEKSKSPQGKKGVKESG